MKTKIKKIKLLALDVDGVLTDGKIIFDSTGREIKVFDVQDGFGIVILKEAGFKTAIITARVSQVTAIRAKDLNIDKIYQGVYPKRIAYEKMLRDFKVTDEEVCFVADDIVDIPILKRVGFGVAVANATKETKKVADYVTQKEGGKGAVREVIELILKSQGQWPKLIQEFFS